MESKDERSLYKGVCIMPDGEIETTYGTAIQILDWVIGKNVLGFHMEKITCADIRQGRQFK